MPRTALISVADKRGIIEFAKRLAGLGIRLLSSAGTAAHLRGAGLDVVDVETWTGSAEFLGGRVKTLHPAIHGAILADRLSSEHMEQLAAREIETIDLVVVDLYPFSDVAGRDDATVSEAIEEIDIGGVAMARAAAKNFETVAVVVDRDDYDTVASALENGQFNEKLRRQLAARAFRATAAYDQAIATYLADDASDDRDRDEPFPARKSVELRRRQILRYGENPHQEAALYVAAGSSGKDWPVTKLHGKRLSYNNLVDLDAALQLVGEFDEPAAAIIKHTNPTGCAVGSTAEMAFERALAADPMSAFGGITVLNREVTVPVAESIHDGFMEIVAAPGFDDGALEVLKQKKNIRILLVDDFRIPDMTVRSNALGWLVQSSDPRVGVELEDCDIPTELAPNEDQWPDLAMAWRVVKHVQSNAIVLVKDGRVIGVGAGQMSRVDAVTIAVDKCVAAEPAGAVLASDAFFPFRDGPERAAQAGVSAIIQPGGSRRDGEVIDACDELGMAMVMTGVRHFRHG